MYMTNIRDPNIMYSYNINGTSLEVVGQIIFKDPGVIEDSQN